MHYFYLNSTHRNRKLFIQEPATFNRQLTPFLSLAFQSFKANMSDEKIYQELRNMSGHLYDLDEYVSMFRCL